VLFVFQPAILGVLISLLFGAGLLRRAGLEIVTIEGERVSRARQVRSLLAWSPILIAGMVQ
jgi:hypothetical protein